jgi:hypothetical protein
MVSQIKVHAFTSITANYLPKARVLAQTLRSFHPEMPLHAVLCDAIPPGVRLEDEPFASFLTLPELIPGRWRQWVFMHRLVEAATGVKGFALRRLLEDSSCEAVLYFDPDIVVLAPLDGLLQRFTRASILLTPHLTEPEWTLEGVADHEISALRHGAFNLGFLGVKKSDEGLRFARWWAARLDHFCFDDIPAGLFTDQRWMDLAPALFAGLEIVRDPEYNVCTWNLSHRRVSGAPDSGWLVNGRPMVFYHFSGIDSGAQEIMLRKYGQGMPALFQLREWYLDQCRRAGQAECSRLPWSFGCYDDGELIRDAERRLYRLREDLQTAFPDPFYTAEAERSYRHWHRTHVDMELWSEA